MFNMCRLSFGAVAIFVFTLKCAVFCSAQFDSHNLNKDEFIAFIKQFLNMKKDTVTRFRICDNHTEMDNLPKELFAQLPLLDAVWINHCSLISLPDDLFNESPNIRNISLAHNNLQQVPAKIFQHQMKLMNLDLSYNKLTMLEDGLFNATLDLVVLRLSHNRLSNISSYLTSGLTELQELYLDNNNLHTVHMTAFDETRLRVLHLQNNRLEFQNFEEVLFDFERASPFQNLDQLEVLNMRNNSIKSFLNDWHTSNVALKELDLSYNQIEMIDFEMMFNIWLGDITINVSNNRITTMRAYHRNESTEIRSHAVWILNDNPLKCDCMVEDFAEVLQNQRNGTSNAHNKFVTNRLKCLTPHHLAGQQLEKISLPELICPLDSENSKNKTCPHGCDCYVRTFDRTVIFNCSNANLMEIPLLPNRHNGIRFYELHIENNNITTLTWANATGYKHVNRIFAKNNSLETILAEHLPDNLYTLDLSINKLKRINSSVLHKLSFMKNLQTISIGQNPLICDCDAYELQNFIKNHFVKMVGINHITCGNDKSSTLKNANGLCPISKLMISIIAICVLIAMLGLFTGAVIALYYKYQTEVKVWLFAHKLYLWWITEEEVDKDKKYDAFISFSHKDEDFVTEHLVPELESGPNPFKLCLHFRDFVVGEFIPNQISKSVEDSRRTVVVLSPNFIDSVWTRMEFRAAHQKSIAEGRARLIVIIYGDIGDIEQLDPELRVYLKTNTYLKWGDPWFFDKLRYALPHPTNYKSKGLIKSTMKSSIDDKLELIKPQAVTPPAIV